MTDATPDYLRALERVAKAAERYLLDQSLFARLDLEAALDTLDQARAAR